MRNILTFLIFTLIALCESFAQTPQEYFMLGNNAYNNAKFQQAKQSYLEAISLGEKSPEIYYNLANTYSKLDEIGNAKLYFLKSLYLNPRNPSCIANYKKLDDGNSPFVNQFFSELSIVEWSAICFASFWLLIALLIILPFYKRHNNMTLLMSVFSFAIFGASLYSIYNWCAFSNIAVAISKDVPIRISPTNSAPTIAILDEAQIASVIEQKDDFYLLETKNKKIGWAKKSQVHMIR